ncbi:hypothetical protein E2C01_024684 [Portunus trituberculatus]|uniref:Uncharacterized protein n=1 Tax=Portunus trituberculatus TaxID=210409 RepID=A0A5B7EDU6_PORTR|nr:hypothetical protein [Portunus trituberculatus]
MGRCHSEGDLAGRDEAGLGHTWQALSRVVQEAGQVLKTLSETSLVLRQQALSPARAAPALPPLLEEGGGPGRRVCSVAVQTDPRHVRGLWRDACTSCDSLSDGETSESGGHYRSAAATTMPSRRWLDVPRQHSAPALSHPRGLHEWRERRERLNRPGGYGGRSSSSEWDSPSPGTERELGAHRCLALHQRRVEESCHRLEERLRLSAHKRHLRRRLLSEHHNHYNTPGRCVLHSSLDLSKTPFCDHMAPPVPSPYLSTPALPTGSPSPLCCCVSPSHLPSHQYCRALASPCSSHAHWSSCHASPAPTPAPEPCYSPGYREARLQASRQQCRDQLAAARRLLGGSSSSLGEGSSPPMPRRPRLTPAGGSLDAHQRYQRTAASSQDTPYLRGHAASLSSLPGAGVGWRRGGLRGVDSLGSVASEGEADPRRASRWRGDSDPWGRPPRLR